MEGLIVMVLMGILVMVGLLPVIALLTALSARTENKRIRKLVMELEEEVFALRKRVERAPVLPTPQPLGDVTEEAPVVERSEEPAPAPVPPPEPLPEAAPVEPPPEEPSQAATPVGPAPEEEADLSEEEELVAAARQSPEPRKAAKPKKPRKPMSVDQFASWLVAGVGGLFLVLAGLFFFAYALDQGWLGGLGPGARFGLGVGFGLGALALSEVLTARKYVGPAAALGGAGVGLLYGALYAGHGLYSLYGNTLAFLLLAAVSVVALLLAWRRDSRVVAGLGLVGAMAVPILLSTGSNRPFALFAYLFLVTGGVIGLCHVKNWASIAWGAVIGTFLYQVGWAAKYWQSENLPAALLATLAFGMLYTAVSRKAQPLLRYPVITALGAQVLGLAPILVSLRFVTYGITGDPELQLASWVLPSLAGWVMAMCAMFFVAIDAFEEREKLALDEIVVLIGRGLMAFVMLIVVGEAAEALGRVSDAPTFLWGGSFAVLALGPLVALLGVATTRPAPLPVDEETPAPIPYRVRSWLSLELLIGLGLMSVAMVMSEVGGLQLAGFAIGGTLAVAASLVYAPLGLVGLGILFLTGLAVTGVHYDEGPMWGPAGGLILAWGPFVARPWLRPNEKTVVPWLAAAFAAPAMYFPLHRAWELYLGETWIGVLPVVLGLVSVGFAQAARGKAVKLGKGKTVDPMVAFVAIAALFATGAIPIQLDGRWVVFGWALEAAVLAWLGLRLKNVVLQAGSLALVVFSVMLLTTDFWPVQLPITGGLAMPLLATVVLYGVISGAYFVAGDSFSKLPEQPAGAPWATMLRFLAVAVAFVGVNVFLAILFADGGYPRFQGGGFGYQMTRSVAWVLFGGTLLAAGALGRNSGTRLVALLYLLLGAGKVFFVDLWVLGGLYRVGAIFGAAVVLIASGVVWQWLAMLAKPAEEEDEDDSDDSSDDEVL